MIPRTVRSACADDDDADLQRLAVSPVENDVHWPTMVFSSRGGTSFQDLVAVQQSTFKDAPLNVIMNSILPSDTASGP
jgi:hypothetical protein